MKWIEFTEYVAPDGTSYIFEDFERFLMSETGFGMPPIRHISSASPFQHGETLYDYRLSPRTIQLVVRNNACSRDQYWERRTELLNAIRPNRFVLGSEMRGVLRKHLPNGDLRDLYVMIEEGPAFAPRNTSQWDEFGFTETLRFVAHDPIFFDPTEVTVTHTLASAQQIVFPLSLSVIFATTRIDADDNITYAGNWLTYPVFTLTGPLGTTIITNVTTQETITLAYTISTGETVTIDLTPGRKTVTSSTAGNLIGSILSVSQLATFHLAPAPEAVGGVNNITIDAASGDPTGASAVSFTYHNRYIGI